MNKSEFALMYFPGQDPIVARNKLRRWINRNTDCLMELAKTGYYTTAKEFTPAQETIIKKYLGGP